MSDVTAADSELPGFRSPHMKNERKMYTKMAMLFMVLLSVIILGILSLYWGTDHSIQFNSNAATVAVIDLDQGEVGPALVAYAKQFRAEMGIESLGYVYPAISQYPDNDAVTHALKQEDFWFAFVVQSNATTLMNYAYTNGNTSYDPNGGIQAYYEEGRNALAIDEFILPQALAILKAFTEQFAKQKQASLLTTNVGNAAALALQAAVPIPISYTLQNRVPYLPTTVEAATEIGTIYLIIVSFVSVLMFDKLNEGMMGKLKTRTYFLWRVFLLPVVYFWLSLLYLALNCAWHIKFDHFFGGVGYFIYWMLTWCSMMAFGLTVENFNNAIGPPFTPVFFVFWVISNVSTGFYPVELLSNFYLWGLAWPLRHNLIGAKAIILGTKNLLGLNFGVILAWVAIGLVLLPVTVRLQIHKKKAVWDKQRQELLDRKHKEDNGESGSQD